MTKIIGAINWNKIEDALDKAVWEKLTEQFWLDTRIPVSKDLADWKKLEEHEKTLFNRVFGGLTLLDTLQSESGVKSLIPYVRTKHEEAVLNNIMFMESVHAKSYSTIFSTFNTEQEITEVFKWIEENPYLQYKANKIEEIYQNGTSLEKKVASVLLESFLFYSGFYTPLKYLGETKMMNTAEVIKLIIRDESIHGTYIGYKFQKEFNELPEEEQLKLKEWILELAFDLWENERKYTKELYSATEWVAKVDTFLEYNLNKAMNNLGFDDLFEYDPKDLDAVVMNGLSTSTSNHDFFSQVGNGYLLGQVEAIQKEDFNLIKGLVEC